jgi:triphosphoribosyl-dephospho-CoA synthase
MIMQLQYAHDRVDVFPFEPFSPSPTNDRSCRSIGRTALNGLYQELCVYPKPGLVSFIDSGSHKDMDASTFQHSLFSLRTYFRDVALAGTRNAGYDELRCLGVEAESRMLKATKNVNTHRGAIFSMGLLVAAAGLLSGGDRSLKGDVLGSTVRRRWGNDILLNTPDKPCSHGTLVASKYGVAGARQEAAAGFPHLFEVGLPVLEESLSEGVDFHSAAIQSFFSLMAVLADNNLLFRGGQQGLTYAQAAARSFLDNGGVHQKNWHGCASSIHHEFIARRLSPGGSADLLAATLFVYQLQKTEELNPCAVPPFRL